MICLNIIQWPQSETLKRRSKADAEGTISGPDES